MKNVSNKKRILVDIKPDLNPYGYLTHRKDTVQKQLLYKLISQQFKPHHTENYFIQKFDINHLKQHESFKDINQQILTKRIREVFKKFSELKLKKTIEYCYDGNLPVQPLLNLDTVKIYRTESIETYLNRGGLITRVATRKARG